MKWTDKRKLDARAQTDRHKKQFLADCLAALQTWNREFPGRRIEQERLKEFLSVAVGFHRVHFLLTRGVPVDDKGAPIPLPAGTTWSPRSWARQPYCALQEFVPSEVPGTKGEYFISELASFGSLCWGWRSPSPRKAKGKSKGGLRRGVLQIVADYFAGIDLEQEDHIELFVDFVCELNGKSTLNVAKEYVDWDNNAREKHGLSAIKNPDLDGIARLIQKRVARLNPR